MVFVSWNCRGLGNLKETLILQNLVHTHKPDFFFLMETLVNKNKIKDRRVKLKFDNVAVMDRVGCRGVLAIYWNNFISCLVHNFGQNFIDV